MSFLTFFLFLFFTSGRIALSLMKFCHVGGENTASFLYLKSVWKLEVEFKKVLPIMINSMIKYGVTHKKTVNRAS